MWTPLSRCVRWVRGLDSGCMEGGGAPFAIRLAISFAATLAVVGALGYIFIDRQLDSSQTKRYSAAETENAKTFERHYLSGGRGAADDARVSPLLADDVTVALTPPALVVTAEYDPLRDDGVAYAERLRSAGVDVTTVHYDSMMHGFVSLADFLDDGQAALSEAAAAVARAIA